MKTTNPLSQLLIIFDEEVEDNKLDSLCQCSLDCKILIGSELTTAFLDEMLMSISSRNVDEKSLT